MKRLLILILILFFVMIFLVSSVSAIDYYVAPDGDDLTGDGTFSNPWGTFLPAVEAVVPGDTIYARGGVYDFDNAMTFHESTTGSYPGKKYNFISIMNHRNAGHEDYFEVNNGEEDNHITVRNYPGETPILDFTNFPQSALYISSDYDEVIVRPAIYVRDKSYWTIEGFEIVDGCISLWGGGPTHDLRTHDIIIQKNHIHDYTIWRGDNPGLIRIDRSDGIEGGAYNIFIWNNTLHGLYSVDDPGVWSSNNLEHFGAVTVLSFETYSELAYGIPVWEMNGTEYIEIINNTVYEVPQFLYSKNPMRGPILIKDNTAHSINNIAKIGASNINFTHNLFYNIDFESIDTTGGALFTGAADGEPEGQPAIASMNITVEYNTFVGLNSLFEIRRGTGHIINNNVLFGLTDQTGYSAYIKSIRDDKDYFPFYEDPMLSRLQNITSDNNCFISPHNDTFSFVMRADTTPDQHYYYSEALATFGYDPNSNFIAESDLNNFFVDSSTGDYNLIDPTDCPGMGYYATSSSPTQTLSEKYPGDVGIEGDAAVIFSEDFEEGSISAVTSRWDYYRNDAFMSLITDVSSNTSGVNSLQITATGGGNTGGDLYKTLNEPDITYLRYYVKVPADSSAYGIHHLASLGGSNPEPGAPTGGAGDRPLGDESFTTVVEPFGDDWAWGFYTYWQHMRSWLCNDGSTDPLCDGYNGPSSQPYFGNEFNPVPPKPVETDEWICVEYMVKLNNPVNSYNGEQAFWINDELIHHLGEGFPNGSWHRDQFYLDPLEEPFEGFQWRNDSVLNATRLWFLYYMTSGLPVGETSRILYDDIVLANERIGCIQPLGQQTNSDVNNDGTTNIIDLALTTFWQGKNSGEGDWGIYNHLDINQDGNVNWLDVVEVIIRI